MKTQSHLLWAGLGPALLVASGLLLACQRKAPEESRARDRTHTARPSSPFTSRSKPRPGSTSTVASKPDSPSNPRGAGELRNLMAFVLLSKPQLPDGAAVASSYRRYAPGAPPPTVELTTSAGQLAAPRPPPRQTTAPGAPALPARRGAKPSDAAAGNPTTEPRLAAPPQPTPPPRQSKGEVLKISFGPEHVAMVALMEAPVPRGEAEAYASYSASALIEGWKPPPHSAHLIVFLSEPPPTDHLASLSRFTALLAALVESSPAIGVYWGHAGATHSAKFFLSTAKEPDLSAKLALWTGVSLAQTPEGRLSLLSLGMRQLELPDLLLTAPKERAQDALALLFDLLNYLAKRGRPIPAGDTVGRSATERLKVSYVDSPVDPSVKVWHVALPP